MFIDKSNDQGTLLRAYPYACLTAMQFLQVSGYIAGVTNPIFEQRQEWWDVLCNVATGTVKLSESYEKDISDENIKPLYQKVFCSFVCLFILFIYWIFLFWCCV